VIVKCEQFHYFNVKKNKITTVFIQKALSNEFILDFKYSIIMLQLILKNASEDHLHSHMQMHTGKHP